MDDKLSIISYYYTTIIRFSRLFYSFLFKIKRLVHTAYDTRHTFATRRDECGISQTNIKVLMGHSLANDVTNNVYTHIVHKYLLNEIKKLKYE